MRQITAVVTLMLLTACTPGAAQPVPPEPAAPASISQVEAGVEERRTALKVPSDFDDPWIEFGSIDRGYALFTKFLTGRHEAMLFSTSDGGKSWVARTHPQPVAPKGHQMYVVDAKKVVLMAEPDAWYISHDGATTWERRPYAEGVVPVEYQPPTNPPGWIAEVRSGVPVTRLNGREINVPKQDDRMLFNARVVVSADGKDTWLIGQPDPTDGVTAGPTGLVLKGTGLPVIWRFTNDAWVPVRTGTMKEDRGWPYSAAPAGDGLVLLVGPDGPGYFDGAWQPIKGLGGMAWIGQAVDGTLVGRSGTIGVFLSAGNGRNRSWIKVVLSRQ